MFRAETARSLRNRQIDFCRRAFRHSKVSGFRTDTDFSQIETWRSCKSLFQGKLFYRIVHKTFPYRSSDLSPCRLWPYCFMVISSCIYHGHKSRYSTCEPGISEFISGSCLPEDLVTRYPASYTCSSPDNVHKHRPDYYGSIIRYSSFEFRFILFQYHPRPIFYPCNEKRFNPVTIIRKTTICPCKLDRCYARTSK